MKNIITITITILLTIAYGMNLNAQTEQHHHVVNSAAAYDESEGIQLHSNIGETIIGYSAQETNALQSGFLQNILENVPAEETECGTARYNHMINGDLLTWDGEYENEAIYELTVFTRDGNILFQDKDYSNSTETFDGTYNGKGLDGTYLYLLKRNEEVCIRNFITITK